MPPREFAPVIVRSVTVKVPIDRAWRYFNRAAGWPSWHTDLERVELSPSGEIGPHSTATLYARKGPATHFHVTAFAPPTRWAWESKILWLTMQIDHQFEALDAGTTRISLVHAIRGVGQSLVARLLARAVAASLDKDLPGLEREMNERA